MSLEHLSATFTAGADLTVEIARLTDGFRYDWADSVFKASGWTTRLGPLPEDSLTPGLYRTSVDVSTWNDGPYDVIFAEVGGPSPLGAGILEIANGSSAPAAPVSGIRLVTLAEMKLYLGIATSNTSQDALLEMLIDAATADIETFCQKAFVIRTISNEAQAPPNVHDLRRRGNLYLRHYPIVSVTSIVDLSGYAVQATEYDIRKEHGILYRPGGWMVPVNANGQFSRWLITYDAGHWTDTSLVDRGLKLACMMLVSYYKSGLRTGGAFGPIQSKTMGQISVTYANGAGGASSQYPGDPMLPLDIIGRIGPWASKDV